MRLKIAFLLSFLFFIVGVLTLPHYGINWDTINHLPRGQVYLRYFLTGKKDFSELPHYQMYWQDPRDILPPKSIRESKSPARSFYQHDAFNFDWYMQIDGNGHPPVSDILSSIFNRVLFGHLKIVNDVDSYRVYGILLAAILVGVVYYWIGGIYGGFSGLIAAASLALYPLFWAESHFNTEKDVPETAYFFFFVYSFYRGFTQKKWKWILASGIFVGLALGTKFNVLFVVFIIVPWLLMYLKGKIFRKENLKLLLISLLAVLIGIVIFYGTWPFLWQDLGGGTQKVFGFYKGIGTSSSLGINTYPLIWIAITTPLVILSLFLVGLIKIVVNFRIDRKLLGFILILVFAGPVVRVVLPGKNIYGGIRQIMEYIPFMAAVAGIGAGYVIQGLKTKKSLGYFLILFGFLSLSTTLIRIHPNENVFFNVLIGGLKGAKEKNITSWGNTFGGAYRQAFAWVNENVEEGSSLVFAHELMPNAPLIWIRPDISFSNTNRSGFLRYGEYAITLTYDGTSTRSYYDAYLENMVKPVYESGVDGVSVVKVWKNDENYVKDPYKKQESVGGIVWNSVNNGILIDLGKRYHLSYLKLQYSRGGCNEALSGRVMTSMATENWRVSSEPIPSGVVSVLGDQPRKGSLYFPFLADEARFIKIEIGSKESCLNHTKVVSVYHFSNLDQ